MKTQSDTWTATVGVIGCGNISDIYFQAGRTFDILDIVACADIDAARAEAKARQHSINALSVTNLLAERSIDLVINLTIPAAHFETTYGALAAGKNVHLEKPLSLTREEGSDLLALAASKGLRLGCAPDTFLGAGLQTCRNLIDEGAIGEPVAATAFMLGHGPEGWHPNPDFFYQQGGGPMFDMGPYYLTALVSLLGPIRRVTGSVGAALTERTIGSGERQGVKIPVSVPTHVAGVLDFQSGPIATIVTSFDVWAHNHPRIEVYGTTGTLSVPDPNSFGGPVRLRRAGESEWDDIELTHGYEKNSRGIGAADLAYTLAAAAQGRDRPHRASGELAYHVLEAMHGIHDASQSDRHYVMLSSCERPKPLPLGLVHGQLDR